MSARAPSSPAVVASGFFVLRTPLLPLTDLTAWGDGLEAAAHLDDGTLDDALARDRLTLRRRLDDIVGMPEFRDALFVASPTLEAAIDSWRKDPDTERGRSAEEALVAYFARAATRPTPFGLFAGCTTGGVGGPTRLWLAARQEYRRHTRLDMDYLWALAAAVESAPELRRDLVVRPNSSLYEVGERLLFAEARQRAGGRLYHLVAVEQTPYLRKTIDRARPGARLDDLVAALVDGEVTREDAEEYLAELVDSQVLVTDARPQLTGPPPTETLVATLSATAPTAGLAESIEQATAGLAAIDEAGLGIPAERYRAVAGLLGDLPVSPDLSRFVQVDMTKPSPAATLGPDVVAELLRGVDVLHAFTRVPPEDGLRQFRDKFTQRYETREVPLALALDEEHGIGFERSTAISADAPLLAGLPLGRHEDRAGRWTDRDGFLLERLTAALAEGSGEVSIEAADVDRVRRSDTPPLPDAFEVLGEVMAASEDALGRGEFQVALQSASGPSGVRLTGRFCHVDEELHRLVAEHLRTEEAVHPDRVFAEVVHLPEGRVGNILSRPVLRGYEIPYLGRSGAPAERQLDLSDLLISVHGERIVLRSRRLDREVVPRLTTAHNYSSRGLGVYRFLCALQAQGVIQGVFWDWGPLGRAPFLPRVRSGRVLLSRARWNLGRAELTAFREPAGSGQFAAVQRLRERLALPRYVGLADADNELVVDLDNVLSIEALARQVKRRSTASFVEVTPLESLAASGPEGRFTHQVLVPFVRSAPAPAPAPLPRRAASIPRRFPPGSEWLYVKLFTGPATADRVLERAAAAVAGSLSSGAADRWFFLRYGDPDWHLRLRVHGRPDALMGETLPLLHRVTAPLLESGEVWRIQLDTYEREVERYGGERGIDLAEQVFSADSDAALAVVRDLRGDVGADLRWRVALLGIDLLFDDLGLSLDQRRALARRARQGYGQEFGAGGAFQREVGRRYRQERASLERLLDPHGETPPELLPSVQALHRRSERLRPLAREIRALDHDGDLAVDLPELAMSFAHMHVNRLLRSAPRAQELVLYEMLDRAYSSRAARSR